MKSFHNLLQFTGNLLMMVLLVGLIALPATSVGLLGVAGDGDKNGSGASGLGGEVLSTEDIRLIINPEDIRSGKYFYNPETGQIELKKAPAEDQNLDRGFDNSFFDEPTDTGESTETIESTTDSPETPEIFEKIYPPLK